MKKKIYRNNKGRFISRKQWEENKGIKRDEKGRFIPKFLEAEYDFLEPFKSEKVEVEKIEDVEVILPSEKISWKEIDFDSEDYISDIYESKEEKSILSDFKKNLNKKKKQLFIDYCDELFDEYELDVEYNQT